MSARLWPLVKYHPRRPGRPPHPSRDPQRGRDLPLSPPPPVIWGPPPEGRGGHPQGREPGRTRGQRHLHAAAHAGTLYPRGTNSAYLCPTPAHSIPGAPSLPCACIFYPRGTISTLRRYILLSPLTEHRSPRALPSRVYPPARAHSRDPSPSRASRAVGSGPLPPCPLDPPARAHFLAAHSISRAAGANGSLGCGRVGAGSAPLAVGPFSFCPRPDPCNSLS